MPTTTSDEVIINAVLSRRDGLEWLTQWIKANWRTQAYAVLLRKDASFEEAQTVYTAAISILYYNIIENRFNQESTLKTYFIGICKNVLKRVIHRNINSRQQSDNGQKIAPTPPFSMEDNELPAIVEQCLSELAEPCRTIERLKLQGQGLESISEEIGRKLRWLKGNSARCRALLIERLKKYGYGR